MPNYLRQIAEIGVLLALSGCVSGAGLAADLPRPTPLPVATDFSGRPGRSPAPDGVITVRPPDLPGTGREPMPRRIARVNAAWARLSADNFWYWLVPLLAF